MCLMFLGEQAMEELVGSGLVRTIAVTNFTITKVQWLMQTAKRERERERVEGARMRERQINRELPCVPPATCTCFVSIYVLVAKGKISEYASDKL